MTEPDAISRRDRKKAETRARIIEESTTLFRLHGYQATTIEDIAEAADVAPRTFYSYFDAKVDVAMIQLEQWMVDFIVAMETRPVGESPEQMHANALAALGERGAVTGHRLRDGDGRPFPPIGVGILTVESEPEVAGRIHQILVQFQTRMSDLFRERLGYPPGSIEPWVLAGALCASWFVAVHGFSEVAAVDPDPPSTDELGNRTLALFSSGIASLWEGRLGPG
jgi:AcrR family transcriptional regulator